jgi:hypothetical protein
MSLSSAKTPVLIEKITLEENCGKIPPCFSGWFSKLAIADHQVL